MAHEETASTSPRDHGDDAALVAALRAGDEAAFATLVDRYHATMLRVARMYVATKEAAEDVVSETFLGLIQGIDRFEARSSLKTWLFRILVDEVLAAEAGQQLMATIDALPPAQRTVITLRDVEGFTGPEVSSLLEISDANQRVLLHRARSKVRAALERYLEEQDA